MTVKQACDWFDNINDADGNPAINIHNFSIMLIKKFMEDSGVDTSHLDEDVYQQEDDDAVTEATKVSLARMQYNRQAPSAMMSQAGPCHICGELTTVGNEQGKPEHLTCAAWGKEAL